MEQQKSDTGCATCGVNQDQILDRPKSSFSISKHWQPMLSAVLLSIGLFLDHIYPVAIFEGFFRLMWYIIAYLPVGYPVLKMGWENLIRGEIFTEFFLMGIATLGAFYIGEYPEGVGVMLFYSVGEAFQHSAVQKARSDIRALLDVRAEEAHLKIGESFQTVHPKTVAIGEVIHVKPGERIPLDGKLLTERAAFDTSAITGESRPRHFNTGEDVLAGMINLNRVIELEVQKTYENSSISRILKMVQDAASRKAKTELFIRSFAKVYTPIVVLLATLLVVLPAFFVSSYQFDDWLYRGLVFLVISCPCALVVSIPLGYFGGIGSASRSGILIKGANFLEALTRVHTVVFDKTGTLTQGVFKVTEVVARNGFSQDDLLSWAALAEAHSSHPIARSILEAYAKEVDTQRVNDYQEIKGCGVKATIDGKTILAGNDRLLQMEKIDHKDSDLTGTVVYMAIDGTYAGYLIIADQIKEQSASAISSLKATGTKRTVMLTGDNEQEAKRMASEIGIDSYFAELLPEDKVKIVEDMERQLDNDAQLVFVGDGINDAPVIARANIGAAIGALGSDAAIEAADVVLMNGNPGKLSRAIEIAKFTKKIVIQNIALALGVKGIFVVLGTIGLVTIWEAVFADVGVALLAIFNATRTLKLPNRHQGC